MGRLAAICWCCALLAPSAWAQEGAAHAAVEGVADGPAEAVALDDGGWRFRGLMVHWDNDGSWADQIDETDRHFTNGAKIDLAFEPGFDAGTREFLAPAAKWPDARLALGFVVAQQIYTASDIAVRDPAPDDRPYAGYLYGGVYLQRRSGQVHDHAELDVGVVGPWSFGEDVQRFIHAAVSNQIEPVGWSFQLANELAVNVRLQRSWRSERAALGGPDGLELDAIPRVGVDLGNVFLRANSDLTLRLGRHLPDDFGPPRLLDYRDATGGWSGEHPWGAYAYARVGVRAVGRNIFLDGNTFADSRSTDPERLVAELELGVRAAFRLGQGFLELGYAWTAYSNEYRAQDEGDTIGAVTVGWSLPF